jgi:hypothetical protein
MLIQNAQNGWSQWFYTNAPAAWFSAVAAVTTLAFVLRSRKKPNRIVVREISNGSLVSIWPSVRDKITVAFQGRPIQKLGQVDVEIFNEGSEVIKKPAVEIALQRGSTILDLLLFPPDPENQIQVNANKVVLLLPHLNPFREHKQIVKVSILLDGDADQVEINGDGEGWSTRHLPLPNARQLRSRRTGLVIAGVCSLIFSIVFNLYLQGRYGIGFFEVSWRAFLSGGIGSLPLFVVAFLAYRSFDIRPRME